MGEDRFRFAYDPAAALRNAPKLMGMELRERGGEMVGGYYINGEPHPYRNEKLKVFMGRGSVWVHEEGGDCVSLTTWLQRYGGAADYKDALRMIRGESQALHWNGEVRQRRYGEVKYIGREVLEAARRYDLQRCPLFRWMCGLFAEDRVRAVWERYNVTTDGKGRAVFWYVNQEGRILFDKRIAYKEDGHRNKDFFPGRQFRVGEGFTGRCYFGAHLPDDGKKGFIVESEKSALLCALYYGGRRVLATGGKGNLREVDRNVLLLPDMDAREEWSAKGEVWPWWERCGVPMGMIPDHADIGDVITYKLTGKI